MLAVSTTVRPLGQERLVRTAAKALFVAVQFTALLAFAAGGILFLSLAISGPIALPIAERSGIPISTADVARALELGSIWPLFAIGGGLSFTGALVTIGALLRRLVPAEAA